ncbi:MAG: SOS response-associated peptidase, partial [Phycisphaerae bacterium]|nr:SOS response-associated peptidase [Phycisphaerae bacterium]
AFREAWKSRRCLVPATAFYEWQVPADGSPKRPHAIASSSGELLALGGIWERWRDPADGTEVRTVAIVTTDANELMEPIHHRMPVIVPSEAWEQWLGAAVPPASLLRPYAADRMQAWRVSTVVNNARNDRPECLVPLGN